MSKYRALITLIATILPSTFLLADTFQGLGHLDPHVKEPISTAYDVSADGTIVVGGSNRYAFIWTQKHGMKPLGRMSTKAIGSRAKAISNDGKIIVGAEYHKKNNHIAFRWTAQTGMRSIGKLPKHNLSNAMGISGDGKTIVGIASKPATQHGFVYRNKRMHQLPEELFFPAGASYDGKIIISHSYRFMNNQKQHIGSLPGGSDGSTAHGISDDGKTIVGASTTDAPLNQAFIWTEETGIQPLGDLPNGNRHSNTWSVNADGSVVVGWADTTDGMTAFIWMKSMGMVNLKTYLINRGLSDQLKEWHLIRATGISPNGRFIVGEAYNPKKQIEAFLITLDD